MNKSIRILKLPLQLIKQIEDQGVYRIFELININLDELGLSTVDTITLRNNLEEYKSNELQKELIGVKKIDKYQNLNEKYSLEDLDLSLRSYNALTNANIHTISELIYAIENMEIYNVENLGTKSIIQVMESVQKIVDAENLNTKIPIYQKENIYDDISVKQMGFTQGAENSLLNLGLDTIGKIRENYLSGQLSSMFNYKTLKVVVSEFGKYFGNQVDNRFSFFKNYLIEKRLGKISLTDLQEYYYEHGVEISKQMIKDKFLNRQDLILEDEYIRLPYLIEKLAVIKIKKESEDILIERFKGNTLQNVADKFGKTRERIRQIVRDRMAQISMFYEEAFVKEYNRYCWHPSVFMKVFGVNDFSYNIIKYLGFKYPFDEEYVFPEEYLKELFAENLIPEFDFEEFKISLPEVFHPRIEIYGKSVEKMTKRVFLEYVIEHFVPADGLHKTKIIAIANKVSKDNNLDYSYDKYIDIVTNTVQGLQNVRYYDYNQITEDVIAKFKEILYSIDSVYSCTYFYLKYQYLMEKIDIRDGYELHFVLRRYFAKTDEFENIIDFNRQPMIGVVGKTFADVIVEKWDQLNKPINLDVFADQLIEDYGYHRGTLINIINATLGDYISLRILYHEKPVITRQTMSKMKEIMADDFYELSELTRILSHHGIKVEDYQYFSNFWLDECGYKTHDVNYIIKKEFSSLKDVFFTRVLKEDIYQITKKDHMMRETTLILFIETLRQEYLAFPVKHNKLVNMRFLEKKGVTEQDIRDYVNALKKYLPKETYFTYDYLLKNNYIKAHPAFEKLESFKLSKDLMIDFIRNVPGIKKTTKGNLFRISKQQTTVAEFLDYLSKFYKTDDFKTLRQLAKEHYGITIRNYDR